MNTRYYLQLQVAKGIGAATQRLILRYVANKGIDLAGFFALPPSDWQDAGLTTRQIDALISAEAIAEDWDQELEARHIRVLGWLDAAYPKRLKRVLDEQAPPILCALGNLELLRGPFVGFCGSRNASEQGIQVAKDTVQQIAVRGWTVVSGHAKGIDMMAHYTALENGGTTIIVAPEGILNFRLRAQLKDLAQPGNVLVLSEFQPNAQWSVANAMTRNRTICGLSDALVIVEAGLKGGTFEAGKFALRVKVPLFVADYAQPGESAAGNPYFIQRGAQPVRRNQDTGLANLQRLFEEVASHYLDLDKPKPLRPVQEPLFTPSTGLKIHA
jgi:DNA protecting protein DprA